MDKNIQFNVKATFNSTTGTFDIVDRQALRCLFVEIYDCCPGLYDTEIIDILKEAIKIFDSNKEYKECPDQY